jgi:hypothetical protein
MMSFGECLVTITEESGWSLIFLSLSTKRLLVAESLGDERRHPQPVK